VFTAASFRFEDAAPRKRGQKVQDHLRVLSAGSKFRYNDEKPAAQAKLDFNLLEAKYLSAAI